MIETKRITNKLGMISIRVPKGTKEKDKAHAESRGESLASFILRAVNKAIDEDNANAVKMPSK